MATISAWAVGSFFDVTRVQPVAMISLPRATTPNGPTVPGAHVFGSQLNGALGETTTSNLGEWAFLNEKDGLVYFYRIYQALVGQL